jgi:aspartate racemase
MKAVGVIGGMGPAATWDFCAKVLRATPAGRDQDHIRLLVDCHPGVPDRNAALAGAGPSPGPVLAEMARGLERSGAEAIVIACNTAHAWADDIRAAVAVPLIDMPAETAGELARRWPAVRRAGLLAVDGCLAAGLYQRALAAVGVEAVPLAPPEQARFMALVYRIKAGDTGAAARTEMRALAETLDTDAILSACTEVPLVLAPADLPRPLLDSTDVLVARTVAIARTTPAP